MADDKTTVETSVEIKVKSDELKKLQKEFENFSKAVSTSEQKIESLKKSMSELSAKKQFMTDKAFRTEQGKLLSSLTNEQSSLKENRELKALWQEDIQRLKAEIDALKASTQATKENTDTKKKKNNAEKENFEAEKKNTNAKKDNTKATEEDTKEKKKKTNKDRHEDTQAKKAEAQLVRANAGLISARARLENAENRDYYTRYKRTEKYQTGRGFYSAGSYLGKNLSAPMANVLGTGFQLIGTSIANPAMGASVAITQLTKAITEFASSSIKAYSEIESIKTQLGVVYGNQTQADQMFGELSQYAIKSPFGVQQTAELATLLKQSGVEATNLMNTLKMLGDTAGGNMEKMKRIANNYAQIVSIGKASMLDMRQFAYAGIPIFEKVAEELNVSQTALRKLISDGKVTSEVITKVFQDMTSEGGLFFEATSKGAETLKARLTNLGDIKQLALSSAGEMGLRLGENYGGDSVAYRGVTLAEDFYDKINKITTLVNLEKSVKSIEHNQSEQERIKELIEYYKKENGLSDREAKNDPVIKKLNDRLIELSNIFDPDKQRSIYSNIYEAYNGEKFAKYGTLEISYNKDEANQRKIEEARETYNNNIRKLSQQYENSLMNPNASNKISYEEYVKLAEQEKQNLDIRLLELAEEQRAIQENIDLVKQQAKITEEIRKGWLETQIINSQQTAYDTVKSSSERSGSTAERQGGALSDLSKIQEEWSKTAEVQAQEKEALIKNLEASRQLLLEIAGNSKDILDKNGNQVSIVDFEKVSGAQLTNYIKQGAVTARKLAVTSDSNTAAEDWTTLRSQLNANYSKYLSELQSKGLAKTKREELERNQLSNSIQYEQLVARDLLNRFSAEAMKNAGADKSINSFYDYFAQFYQPTMRDMTSRLNNATSDEVRDFWKQQIENLENSLLQVISSTDIPPEAVEDIMKDATAKEFIPLWKRILGSATGISPNVMNSVGETLNWYSNDMAIRNNTSGVLGAALRNGGNVTTLQSLLKSSTTNKELKNAGFGTWQIDWEATGKAVSKFATSLGAANEVLEAYRKGLEDELDTYISLLSNGLTQTETQDLTSGKMISAKRYAELEKEYGGFFVNAFGEKLFSDKGLEVTVKDGQFVDSRGNIVAQENVKISGNIYTLLQDKLTDLQKRIATAKLQEENNRLYEKYISSFNTSQIIDSLINIGGPQENGYSGSMLGMRAANMAIENPEYVNAQFKNIYDSKKDTGFDSMDAFMLEYKLGDDKAIALMNQLIRELNTQLENVIRKLAGGDSTVLLDKLKSSTEADQIFASTVYEAAGRGAASNKFGDNLEFQKGPKEKTWGDYKHAILGGDVLKEAGYSGDDTIEQLSQRYTNLSKKQWESVTAQIAMNNALHDMSKSILDISKQTAKDGFLSSFSTIGESLVTGADYLDLMRDNLKQVGAQMLQNMGATMADTGFKIAAAGATSNNWGMIAGGLALAAAGGFASGLGGAITNAKKDTKDKDESAKLESLTDQIQKLLEQARSDALYYENNLRHRTALGANEKFSYKSVNDMILTPHGNFSTAPDDYIIATKQPQNLNNNKGPTTVTVQPVINSIVHNNANVQTRQEQVINDDGSIDVITYIENAMADFIASSKGDDAFTAREVRLNGRRSVM